MSKVLNFGSLNIDYVYQMDHIIKPGETEASRSRGIFPGGKGLNQSVALSRAGSETWHAGALGPGDNSILTDVLKDAGVRLDYLRTHDIATGHTVIQVDKSGQNSIILFGGANRSLKDDEIEATFADFGKGDLLVLQNEVNGLEKMMRLAASRGMKTAFNVSPFTPDLLDLPLDLCSVLLVNEIEGGAIAGMDPSSDPDKLIDGIRRRVPECTVVLTLGTRGSVLSIPGRDLLACGCCKVKAVDTTGSGDTYTGFLLTMLMKGEEPKKAMQVAATAAAISVTRPGAACSIPSMDEVAASPLLKNVPDFKG
jgi:ribokinase